jgi:hypothetical protein
LIDSDRVFLCAEYRDVPVVRIFQYIRNTQKIRLSTGQKESGSVIMDFVSAWKAASIALTGAFGLMGLLKEHKNKETGKLTMWGKVLLCGIILSTTLGIVAQLKENTDESQRRVASATQTVTLLKQTSSTVSDIQRLLSPFEISKISLRFDVDCDDPKFADFCAKATKLKDSSKSLKDLMANMAAPALWKMWPKQYKELIVQFYFFRDLPNPEKLSQDLFEGISDLTVEVPFNYGIIKVALFPIKNGKIQIEMSGLVPSKTFATGKMTSLMDVQDANLIITDSENNLAHLTPTYIKVTTKQNREITIENAKFTTFFVGGIAAYLYRVGNSASSLEADK